MGVAAGPSVGRATVSVAGGIVGGMGSVWVGSGVRAGEPQDVKMESRKNKENRRIDFCIAVF